MNRAVISKCHVLLVCYLLYKIITGYLTCILYVTLRKKGADLTP